MAKVTLYTFGASQNAVRPELALLEKSVPFEKRNLALLKGEHQKAPFKDLSPRRQVPTLVYQSHETEIVLYESIAIIRFIDDIFPDPPLMPSIQQPRLRALAEMRIAEFQAKLDHRNIFGSVVFRRQGTNQLKERIKALTREIEFWEAYTKDHAFLAGDKFTLADIAVFPLLMHFEVLGYDFEQKAPSLFGYMERCKARPSVVTSGWLEELRAFCQNRNPEQVLKN